MFSKWYFISVTVSLGSIPGEEALVDVPIMGGSPDVVEEGGEATGVRVAKQASALMSLLSVHTEGGAKVSGSRVWLGAGLGSVPRRVYDKMMRWEFVDMVDLQVRSHSEKVGLGEDTQKVVVLPGFEVSQARRKPLSDIVSWVQCFARYAAAMAQKYPECTVCLVL